MMEPFELKMYAIYTNQCGITIPLSRFNNSNILFC